MILSRSLGAPRPPGLCLGCLGRKWGGMLLFNTPSTGRRSRRWPSRSAPAACAHGAKHCALLWTKCMLKKNGQNSRPPPPGVAELGPDVWRADKPLAERGLKVRAWPSATRSMCVPGRRHGCRKSRSCWISCPNCQISSALGCCSPCARPHAPIMLCGQSRQQWLPHMPKCMMMLFGTPWTLSLAGSRQMRQQVREPWLSSQHRSGASDWQRTAPAAYWAG